LARSLTTFSERGRIVPEANDPTIRELFLVNYRLLYQVRPEVVYVLAIIHGARDLKTLWETLERRKNPGIEDA